MGKIKEYYSELIQLQQQLAEEPNRIEESKFTKPKKVKTYKLWNLTITISKR
jgi:hypothetical protein